MLAQTEALLAIVIFSFVPVAIKYTSANPFTIGFFRLLITCIGIGYFWRSKIEWSKIVSKNGLRLCLIGLLFFGHWLTYFFAIKIGGSSACVLGMSTYGIQLIIYGSLLLNYHLRPKNYLSLLMVVGGLIFILPEWSHQNNFNQGVVLGLISACFYSLIPIVHQRTNQYFNHHTRIFSQFFFCFLGFSLFFPKTNWQLSGNDWMGLLFLAIFGTLIAHSLWALATSKLPTHFSGVIYYAITPSALFWAHLFLNEELNVKQIFGATLIIVAAIYNVWSFHAHQSGKN